MGKLRGELEEIIRKYKPMTVRQVFYQAVSRGLIDKTEAAYKGIVRVLGEMRKDGVLPFQWIADSTRWMRKPRTHGSLADFMEESQRFYRRDLWQDLDVYVEIWLEKEALAGVLSAATQVWGVPLMVTRGYPSLSYLHSAAETIAEEEKPTFLYYFGDHDPSGVDIPRFVEEAIREMAPEADVQFRRVAVTEEQIVQMKLLTRPTKKSDSRSKAFEGESVEVDAIEPTALKRLCEECITSHIESDVLDRVREVEQAERQTLAEYAAALRRAS